MVRPGNGDGTFQPGFNIGSGPVSHAAIGDVNGDGNPDVVTAGNGSIGVLLGNGTGLLQPFGTASAAPSPNLVVVADFTGDHKPDVVNRGSSGGEPLTSGIISLLAGNGDGTFQAHQDFPINGYSTGFGLAVADFDKNGSVDVATTGATGNAGGTGVSLFLNQ